MGASLGNLGVSSYARGLRVEEGSGRGVPEYICLLRPPSPGFPLGNLGRVVHLSGTLKIN